MSEENISQEFIMKNIDDTRTCLIEEINGNELISEKYRVLNYTEQLLIFISTFT